MIYVLLADGFEEIEALAFVDILKRADIKVETVSIYDHKNVRGAHDITVLADTTISEIGDIGCGIVLPGGLPGTYNLRDSKSVKDIVTKYNNAGKYIGAICAAPSVLGTFGILNGKTATCYPSFENQLNCFEFNEDRVVHDGNVITSRGAGTAHDFAFKFVEIIKDKDTANKIRSSMLYDI